jgi:protein-S-isoprenylcysteine O-methyltransferase Ste14
MIEVSPIFQSITFFVSLSGAVAIFALAILDSIKPSFQFFPPPSKKSWQHHTFMALFRLFLYPLVALSVLVFEPVTGARTYVSYGLGGSLIVLGFGLAFWITVQMGWRNAFGEKRGLRTDGWFRFSRNPIYVATWVGLIGWGVLINHTLVTVLLALWGLMYMLAPLVEEPWLEEQYGEPYHNYKQSTPRFIWFR